MPNHAELLEILLKNRGILPKDAEKFLNPEYQDLYDPYLLKDLEKACIRIFEAIEAKEKVVIYSDYDCDGIPAAVILHDFFKKIGYENFEVYIPDRAALFGRRKVKEKDAEVVPAPDSRR